MVFISQSQANGSSDYFKHDRYDPVLAINSKFAKVISIVYEEIKLNHKLNLDDYNIVAGHSNVGIVVVYPNISKKSGLLENKDYLRYVVDRKFTLKKLTNTYVAVNTEIAVQGYLFKYVYNACKNFLDDFKKNNIEDYDILVGDNPDDIVVSFEKKLSSQNSIPMGGSSIDYFIDKKNINIKHLNYMK